MKRVEQLRRERNQQLLSKPDDHRLGGTEARPPAEDYPAQEVQPVRWWPWITALTLMTALIGGGLWWSWRDDQQPRGDTTEEAGFYAESESREGGVSFREHAARPPEEPLIERSPLLQSAAVSLNWQQDAAELFDPAQTFAVRLPGTTEDGAALYRFYGRLAVEPHEEFDFLGTRDDLLRFFAEAQFVSEGVNITDHIETVQKASEDQLNIIKQDFKELFSAVGDLLASPFLFFVDGEKATQPWIELWETCNQVAGGVDYLWRCARGKANLIEDAEIVWAAYWADRREEVARRQGLVSSGVLRLEQSKKSLDNLTIGEVSARAAVELLVLIVEWDRLAGVTELKKLVEMKRLLTVVRRADQMGELSNAFVVSEEFSPDEEKEALVNGLLNEGGKLFKNGHAILDEKRAASETYLAAANSLKELARAGSDLIAPDDLARLPAEEWALNDWIWRLLYRMHEAESAGYDLRAYLEHLYQARDAAIPAGEIRVPRGWVDAPLTERANLLEQYHAAQKLGIFELEENLQALAAGQRPRIVRGGGLSGETLEAVRAMPEHIAPELANHPANLVLIPAIGLDDERAVMVDPEARRQAIDEQGYALGRALAEETAVSGAWEPSSRLREWLDDLEASGATYTRPQYLARD